LGERAKVIAAVAAAVGAHALAGAWQSAAGPDRDADRAMQAGQATLGRADIRRYARRHCHRTSIIEDVVQEALIVVYRRVGTIRSPAALAGWLVTVVARLCTLPALMLMRGVEELASLEESRELAKVPPDELRMDLVNAIESLSPSDREVVLLRDLEDLTIGEIAGRLGVTREAAKSRLRRARALVREYLLGTKDNGREST
jgi:RNA polymerase sigma factor (sigma-70 family)